MASSLKPPQGIQAHKIRGAAASAAFDGTVSLLDICRAVTSAHMFIKLMCT